MMSGPRLEHMSAMSTASAIRWARHNGRALIIRFVCLKAVADIGFSLLPCFLKLLTVSVWTVTRQKVTIRFNTCGDEIFCNIPEDRPPLLVI